MSTSTSEPPPVPTTAEPSGPDLPATTRRGLYETMVLSRAFEEAILREYHADKGPGFDIGKGLIPGEMHLSAGQEPVAPASARTSPAATPSPPPTAPTISPSPTAWTCAR